MQRLWLSVLIVGIALAIVSSLNTFVFAPAMTMPMSPDMMNNIMLWFTFWPTLLVASLIIIAFAAIMNYTYPSIAFSPSNSNTQLSAKADNQPSGSIDIITKMLKPEELRVIHVIREAGGSIKQNDVTQQTNFSRLKVHRIIARLAERGIIRVEKAGKTNNIYLAEWFQKPNDT